MKDKNINIRVTADQHKQIIQQARKLGLTISAYILMLTEGASK
jgi:predicted DNA binding CopG/RHH family protein